MSCNHTHYAGILSKQSKITILCKIHNISPQLHNSNSPQSTGLKFLENAKSHDAHWNLVSVSASDAGCSLRSAWKVNRAPSNNRRGNLPSANWIGADVTGISLPGDYTYETKFDQSEISGSVCEGSISFDYSADDYVKEIKVNGETVYACGESCKSETTCSLFNWFMCRPKTVHRSISGSVQGSDNILQFIVHNNDNKRGKPTSTGFLFQFNEVKIFSGSCKRISQPKSIPLYSDAVIGTIVAVIASILIFVFLKPKRNFLIPVSSKLPMKRQTVDAKQVPTVSIEAEKARIDQEILLKAQMQYENTEKILAEFEAENAAKIRLKAEQLVNAEKARMVAEATKEVAAKTDKILLEAEALSNRRKAHIVVIATAEADAEQIRLETAVTTEIDSNQKQASDVDAALNAVTTYEEFTMLPPEIPSVAVNSWTPSTSNVDSKSLSPSIPSSISVPPVPYVVPPFVDAFVRRLRHPGFKVERIKDNGSKDQVLRLNGKRELQWSKMSSFYHKFQPITALKNVDVNEQNEIFVLKFETSSFTDNGEIFKTKMVYFKVKESEFPFDAKAMKQYFTAILKKLELDQNYVENICLMHEDADSEGDVHSEVDDNGSDNASVISNVSSKSITGRIANMMRRHSFSTTSLQHQQSEGDVNSSKSEKGGIIGRMRRPSLRKSSQSIS